MAMKQKVCSVLCATQEGVHVTLMYDSRLLLPVVRADLIRPGGDTVEMSVILQILKEQENAAGKSIQV